MWQIIDHLAHGTRNCWFHALVLNCRVFSGNFKQTTYLGYLVLVLILAGCIFLLLPPPRSNPSRWSSKIAAWISLKVPGQPERVWW